MTTSSPHFRFGFKFYDSREPLFSAGSVQTVGQNVLFHVGKNSDNPTWFATSYRASYRLGPDMPLDQVAACDSAHFVLDISSAGSVKLRLDDKPIYDLFFPIDGIPNLALLAWGGEHEGIECLYVSSCSGLRRFRATMIHSSSSSGYSPKVPLLRM
jgi:hypothetical protein